MDLLKSYLPVFIMLALHLILQIPALSNIWTSAPAIKARITIGCLAAVAMLVKAILSGNTTEIVFVTLIVSLMIYGMISLHKKYLYVSK